MVDTKTATVSGISAAIGAAVTAGALLLTTTTGGCPPPGPSPAPSATITIPAPATTAPPPIVPTTYPNITNTGVPAGTTLTVVTGGLNIRTAGAVIDAQDIHGSVQVYANNVTIKRSKVTSGNYWGIKLEPGYSGLTISDTTIVGVPGCGAGVAFASNMTLTRLNVSSCEDLVHVGSNVLLQDSYLHNPWLKPGGHVDGVQSVAGTNVIVKHNTIVNPYSQTSALLFKADSNNISNITITGNYLQGGSYTTYCRSANGHTCTGMTISGNTFGLGYKQGYAYGLLSADVPGSVTWTSNRWADTGATIARGAW